MNSDLLILLYYIILIILLTGLWFLIPYALKKIWHYSVEAICNFYFFIKRRNITSLARKADSKSLKRIAILAHRHPIYLGEYAVTSLLNIASKDAYSLLISLFGRDHYLDRYAEKALTSIAKTGQLEFLEKELHETTDFWKIYGIINVLRNANTSESLAILIGSVNYLTNDSKRRALEAICEFDDSRARRIVFQTLKTEGTKVLYIFRNFLKAKARSFDLDGISIIIQIYRDADSYYKDKMKEALCSLSVGPFSEAIDKELTDNQDATSTISTAFDFIINNDIIGREKCERVLIDRVNNGDVLALNFLPLITLSNENIFPNKEICDSRGYPDHLFRVLISKSVTLESVNFLMGMIKSPLQTLDTVPFKQESKVLREWEEDYTYNPVYMQEQYSFYDKKDEVTETRTRSEVETKKYYHSSRPYRKLAKKQLQKIIEKNQNIALEIQPDLHLYPDEGEDFCVTSVNV